MVLRAVFWGLPGFWRRVGCMCDYVVLPLLNSSFEPGRAREVVEGFVDVDLRNIWCATRQVDKLNNENFFFPGTVYVPGCLCNAF